MKFFLPLLLSSLFLSGCLSPKSSPKIQYYQLEGFPAEADTSEGSDSLPLKFIVVGPVAISPYLDSPKIAQKAEGHEVTYEQYHRWAEPLTANISEVIAKNLRDTFKTAKVGAYSPRLLIRSENPRVLLSITRFDSDSEGNARLKAQWSFTNLTEMGSYSEIQYRNYQFKASGDRMGDRVAAMNKLVNDLSKDIAADLKTKLPGKTDSE